MPEKRAVNEQEETTCDSPDSSSYGVENEQILVMLEEEQCQRLWSSEPKSREVSGTLS